MNFRSLIIGLLIFSSVLSRANDTRFCRLDTKQGLCKSIASGFDQSSFGFFLILEKSLIKTNSVDVLEHEISVSPIWKSLWFKILLLIALALIVFLAIRQRIYSNRNQKKLLTNLVSERTADLVALNKVLEDRNREILKQSRELKQRQGELLELNQNLEESHNKVEKQKHELEKSRRDLEEVVMTRTYELEMAKRRAEESEQLKMAFLSNMSHEIRTPMNAIVGFASLLVDLDLDDLEKQQYVKQINVNSEALLLLIDDILDLSKIEANQLRISKEKFEVNQFINQVYLNWKHIQTSKGSKIEFKLNLDLPDESVYIYSDQQRVRQILNNLLDNAFKFTSDGIITLTCAMKGDKVMFSVTDSGIGISEEDKKFIFDRFRKAIDSEKKLYRGAGLGLTISHKLTELLEGKIWFDSIAGRGSDFGLSLPVQETSKELVEVAGSLAKLTVNIDLKGVNILVAEDEEANYFYLYGVLTKVGAKVDHAVNGEEAIKMSTIKEYDIILMDIKMPKLGGVEATRKIKLMFPNQVVIAQTAYARPEEETEFRKTGFDGYLTKPIKIEAMFHTIKEFL